MNSQNSSDGGEGGRILDRRIYFDRDTGNGFVAVSATSGGRPTTLTIGSTSNMRFPISVALHRMHRCRASGMGHAETDRRTDRQTDVSHRGQNNRNPLFTV